MCPEMDGLNQIALVGNAVKFTDAPGHVSVRALRGADGEGVVLEVCDTGIGIAPADLSLIFERFVQPDASLSRAHGGSGLGLSLVKDLVDELGGSVAVSSVPGEGSVFAVTLSTGRPPEPKGERADGEDTLC